MTALVALYAREGGRRKEWLRGLDLNQRPPGYEPDELPGCSTPRTNDTTELSRSAHHAQCLEFGCGTLPATTLRAASVRRPLNPQFHEAICDSILHPRRIYTRGLLSWVTVSRSASRKNFKS